MANLRVDKITSTETFETTGSVQFDGDDHLSVAASDDNDFGTTTDYTIEFWAYFSKNTSSSNQYVFDMDSNGTRGQLYQQDFYFYFTSSIFVSTPYTGTGEWVHLALCRSGGVGYGFKNGILIGTISAAASAGSSSAWRIGQYGGGSHGLEGHISNFRILKGKALYTENFKPPMRELEVTPETTLLCCQSKTDASLEKTGKTITVNGNAVANELTPGILTPVPKAGAGSAITGSVEFPGSSGDYLTVPNTEDLRLADSDFTIEFWATISKVDSTYSAFALFENSSALRSYQLEVRSNGAVRFEWWYDGSSANDITTGTGIVIVNEWYHYAVSRNGATLKLFINGVEVGSSDVGTNSFFDNTATPFIIGGMFQSGAHQQRWQGNISNLRIVKGTALYVDDFVPPTRELKKVPGTVLLCCQDPDSPLTEATGKTITGFGDFYELDENVDLSTTASWVDGSTGAGSASESNGELTMQGNDGSNRGIISKTVTEGIRPGVTYQMSFEIFDAASNGKLGLDSNDGTDDVLDNPANTLDMVHFSGGSLDGNTGIFTVEGTATTHQVVMYFQEFGDTGTTEFKVRNITLRAVNADSTNINKASNFTPQVGDDRKVTFEGVTKINTENYFYLPTGNTESRTKSFPTNASDSTRGVIAGGGDPTARNTMSFITLASTGDDTDFGDLTVARSQVAGCASATRGIAAGGTPDASAALSSMDYITVSSKGNAQDFGDLLAARRRMKGCGSANSTRGIIAGGFDTSNDTNRIEYITISSTGDSQDFGDLTQARGLITSVASPTRVVHATGYAGGGVNTMDYITIQSQGNSIDFGDRDGVPTYCGAEVSDGKRGVFMGGDNPAKTDIDFIQIATTGNAKAFGDLVVASACSAGLSSPTRGVKAGGANPGDQDNIEYITIASTGDAQDFGDLETARGYPAGLSNGHGGLG